MRIISLTFLLLATSTLLVAQSALVKEIKEFQKNQHVEGNCLDFIRDNDIKGVEEASLQQIILIRHGEPAMNKKGWKNRKEAIRYTEMYDSVGVYDFDKKPICLREHDNEFVFTSKLPRAINTAEKTLHDSIRWESLAVFNEFERKIIQFPNIKLPRQFWSITTRIVWMMGFNHKGIESFRQAKGRAKKAAAFLDENVENKGKTILFAHGFLNRYIKKYLKNLGYQVIDFEGQKYLGAYYFYKIKTD